MKMDSLYSQNLNAFDKEYKDKDSAISLAVIEAKYATQKNFGKDSALLAEKHRNLSFNLDDNILTVGGKIDGKDKTLYAERLQELRHQ